MTAIRDDLDGVVYVDVAGTRVMLRAGDEVPDGVTVGDHLLDRSDDAVDDPADPLREGEPLRRGREATRAAWFKYATEVLELADVPEKAKRDEIIALVDAHHDGQTDGGDGGDL